MHLLAGRPGRARKNFHVPWGVKLGLFWYSVLLSTYITWYHINWQVLQSAVVDAIIYWKSWLVERVRMTRSCFRRRSYLAARQLGVLGVASKVLKASRAELQYLRCDTSAAPRWCYWPCSKKRRWDTCLNSFHRVHFWHCCCWAERRFAHPLTFVADRSLEWKAKETFHLMRPSLCLHFCCLTCCVTLFDGHLTIDCIVQAEKGG